MTKHQQGYTAEEQALFTLCRESVAPALTAYVQWVLQQAQQRGVGTLYFLARDGQILLEIARRLCAQQGLDVDCRYLYCSRKALRTPSYHLLGDEAGDLLFADSRNMSLNEIFNRAGFSAAQKQAVLADLGVSGEAAAKPFAPGEAAAWRKKLQQSAFVSLLEENSRAAFDAVIAYFRQEGLFAQETIALVDSGWAGSSQRSLRQLLDAAGYQGKLTGFYFGLIREKKEEADGEYVPFLFSAKTHYWAKVLFNLNVFECLLAAPHGMTLGYALRDGVASPVLAASPAEKELRRIGVKNAGVLAGAEGFDPQSGESVRRAIRELRRLMVCPRMEEAKLLGSFGFSDDIGAEAQTSLVGKAQLAAIRECFILTRLWRKVTGSKKEARFRPFWSYGTVAMVPGWLRRQWYRANVLLWEMLKYMG